MAIKQICVFLENKPGTLQRAVQVLADARIDLRALSIADTQDYGILRIIVRRKDLEPAAAALSTAGFLNKANHVVVVEIPDEPGGLARIASLLAEGGYNIEYAYAFLTPVHGRACVVLRVNDYYKATDYLRGLGIGTIEWDD